jgi:hypothetical protein
MARYSFQGTFRDGQGNIVEDGTVSVFLAGTTTAATIYTSDVIVASTSSVTSDEKGYFIFYVDNTDYGTSQLFDITLSKTGYDSQTYSDISIFNVSTSNIVYLSSYTSLADALSAIGTDEVTLILDTAGTVSVDTTFPATLQVKAWKTGILTIDSGKTLTINGPFEAGLYQVFDCVDSSGRSISDSAWDITTAGAISFSTKATPLYYPEWWRVVVGSNCLNAFKAVDLYAPQYSTIALTGAYSLVGTTSPMLPLSKSHTWKGMGTFAQAVSIAVTAANTIDFIQLYSGSRRTEFIDIQFTPVGTDTVKDWITASAFTAQFTIKGCWINANTNTSTGYAVNLVGGVSGSGHQFLKIEDSILYGGIKVYGGGDSMYIERNNIKGYNRGIDIDMVSGASDLCIRDNNIVNTDGAVRVVGGFNIDIQNNNTEQSTAASDVSIAAGTNYSWILENLNNKSGNISIGTSSIINNKLSSWNQDIGFNGMLLTNCAMTNVENNTVSAGIVHNTGTYVAGLLGYGIRLSGSRSFGNSVLRNRLLMYSAYGGGVGIGIGVGVTLTKLKDNEFFYTSGNTYTTDTAYNASYPNNYVMFIEDHGIATSGIEKFPVEVRQDSSSYPKGQLLYVTADGRTDIWQVIRSYMNGESAAAAPASGPVGTIFDDGNLTMIVLSTTASEVEYYKGINGKYSQSNYTGQSGYSTPSTWTNKRLSFYKDNNYVNISGSVNAGAIADGAAIFVVPVGYYPNGRVYLWNEDNKFVASTELYIEQGWPTKATSGTAYNVTTRTDANFININGGYPSAANYEYVTTLSADAAEDDTLIKVASAATMAVNHCFAFTTQSVASSTYYMVHFIATVKSGTDITIYPPLPIDVPSGLRLYKLTSLNSSV